MSEDVENMDVKQGEHEDVTHEQTESTQGEEIESSQDSMASQPQSNDQNKNWANARSTIASLQEEVRQLKAYTSAPTPTPPPVNKYDPDDFMTYGEFMKLQQEREIAETPKKYNDYYEVVEKYTNPMVKENPELEETILNSKNPRATAYRLAKLYAKAHGFNTKEQTKNGQVAKENLQKKEPTSSHAANATSALNDMGNYQGNSGGLSKREQIWRQAQMYASKR